MAISFNVYFIRSIYGQSEQPTPNIARAIVLHLCTSFHHESNEKVI